MEKVNLTLIDGEQLAAKLNKKQYIINNFVKMGCPKTKIGRKYYFVYSEFMEWHKKTFAQVLHS